MKSWQKYSNAKNSGASFRKSLRIREKAKELVKKYKRGEDINRTYGRTW